MAYKFRNYEFEEATEVKDMSPAKVEANGPETKNGKVVGALFVNVRKRASLGAEVVETLARGEKVAILGKVKDFYKISMKDDTVAYIASKFIEEE